MTKRHIALIPAYEPDGRMLSLIGELSKKGFEVVVVDDGSGDAYSDIFEKAEQSAIVLTHETNRCKGAALKTGMSYIYKYMAYSESAMTPDGKVIRSGKDAVIVTVDADGQHTPQDALRIAEIAGTRKDALVLGSREFTGDVPARSMMGNTITRHVYNIATGVAVRDTQTGLRAFSRNLIPELLEIDGERYEYEINMLLELAREGTPIIEEDIETIYIEGNSSSHFNTVKDSFKIYKEIIKFSASSFIGFLIDYMMFALLIFLTGAAGLANGLVISNIGARIVSSIANYSINRKLVFKSKAKVGTSALQYFLLAGIILVGNTIVLRTLTGTLGISSMVAKIMTEMIFFFISWTVQKYVIFFNGAGSESERKSGSESCNEAGAGSKHKRSKLTGSNCINGKLRDSAQGLLRAR